VEWIAFEYFGIIAPYLFEDDHGAYLHGESEELLQKVTKFLFPKLRVQDRRRNNHIQMSTLWFQQDRTSSGVARGASGGTRSGAQALGAQQHTFCNHFKRVFKWKFGPNYA